MSPQKKKKKKKEKKNKESGARLGSNENTIISIPLDHSVQGRDPCYIQVHASDLLDGGGDFGTVKKRGGIQIASTAMLWKLAF